MARRGGEGDRQRDPERTRARILRAATSLFTRCGLDGASLDDISRHAGVNRGLIYHYFKTKETLFDQVLARPLASFAQSQLDLLHRRDVDLASLRDAVANFFRFLGEHPELVRLMSWTMAMRRLPQLAHTELVRGLFTQTVERIDAARRAGRLRSDVDPAHLLVTAIDLCLTWHIGKDEWIEKLSWKGRDPRAIDEERLAAILDVLEAAARPSPAPATL